MPKLSRHRLIFALSASLLAFATGCPNESFHYTGGGGSQGCGPDAVYDTYGDCVGSSSGASDAGGNQSSSGQIDEDGGATTDDAGSSSGELPVEDGGVVPVEDGGSSSGELPVEDGGAAPGDDGGTSTDAGPGSFACVEDGDCLSNQLCGAGYCRYTCLSNEQCRLIDSRLGYCTAAGVCSTTP